MDPPIMPVESVEPVVQRKKRWPVIDLDWEKIANSGPVDFSKEENILKHVRSKFWVSFDVGKTPVFRFNWVVSVLASVILWGFIIAVLASSKKDDAFVQDGKTGTTMSEIWEFPADLGNTSRMVRGNWTEVDSNPALAEFAMWKSWISTNFAWFFIGTQDVWVIFLLYVGFSKYGDIKLGKKHEKPEFSDVTWFSMLFSCGVSIGLYYYGAAEPVYYYRSMHLYKPGFFNDDQRAQQAMFVTFYHWGLHAWIVYILVAVLLGVVCFRWDMPLTLRSAFFPLIGDVIYGPLGDLIDALSMAATTFGVCTSLGVGVMSINAGMSHINPDIKKGSEAQDIQVGIIWAITAIATISVCTGLKKGLKVLSQITFSLGCVFLLMLFYMDNTWYIMNVYTQSIGYYFQWIIQIGWECDAFQQLNFEFDNSTANLYADSGHSRLFKDLTKAVGRDTLSDPNEFYGSTEKRFLDWWTIFYWAWWIAWAPFVGMFIARISRGRTIRQVLIGGLMAPCFYGFFFISVLGGLGIKMERAVELALDVAPDPVTGEINCTAMGYDGGVATSPAAVALANIGYTAVACRSSEDIIFDVVEPYGEKMGTFLKVVVLAAIVLYFITSSDSGSYVDDTLSAGGMLHPPIIQRIYWAITEGACATALLVGGKDQALTALQTVSICSGFPYTVLICFMCTSLWRAVKFDCKEDAIHTMTRFCTGLFDWTELFNPKARVEGLSTLERVLSLIISFYSPYLTMHDVNMKLFGNMGWFHTIGLAVFFLSWIGCMIGELGTDYTSYVGWMLFTVFVAWMAVIRIKAREAWDVYGFGLEDFFACFVMWPFVASQLALQSRHGPAIDPKHDPLAPKEDRFANYPVEGQTDAPDAPTAGKTTNDMVYDRRKVPLSQQPMTPGQGAYAPAPALVQASVSGGSMPPQQPTQMMMPASYFPQQEYGVYPVASGPAYTVAPGYGQQAMWAAGQA